MGYRQSSTTFPANGASFVYTPGSPVKKGSFLGFIVGWGDNTANRASIQDTHGNYWRATPSAQLNDANSGESYQLFLCPRANFDGTPTLTISFINPATGAAQSESFIYGCFFEYDSLDGGICDVESARIVTTATTSLVTNAITPRRPGSTVIAIFVQSGTVVITGWGVNAPFTMRENTPGNGSSQNSVFTADCVQSTDPPTSQTATFVVGSTGATGFIHILAVSPAVTGPKPRLPAVQQRAA
jgi:hypothetical protein